MSVEGVYRKKKDYIGVGVPIMILLKEIYVQGTYDNKFVSFYYRLKKEPWMKDYDKIVEKELMTWQ